MKAVRKKDLGIMSFVPQTALMASLLEKISDGFFVVDRQWRVVFANQIACQIANRQVQDVIGGVLWDMVPQYLNTEISAHYWKSMETGEPASFVAFVPELKAWVETRLFPSDEGMIGYFRNITAQKEAEQKSQEVMATLEERSRELALSNRELKDFAAVTSHDLKEPLRSVIFYLDLVMNPKSNEEKRSSWLVRAKENSVRCIDLIDSLLEHASLGNQDLELQTVDSRETVLSILTVLASSIEQTKASISLGELPMVYADPIQLRRIFQNLISNALKYKKSDTAPVIQIGSEKSKEGVVFFVEDNGQGIDSSETEKIFQLFRRSSKNSDGYGIGLATVRKLIKLHGGWIRVKSDIGMGSRFEFLIPERKC